MLQMHIGFLNCLHLIVFKYLDDVCNKISVMIDTFLYGFLNQKWGDIEHNGKLLLIVLYGKILPLLDMQD